jgi:4-amino-4-deoxy-L-arabinose transferase-like glycosyltransferase
LVNDRDGELRHESVTETEFASKKAAQVGGLFHARGTILAVVVLALVVRIGVIAADAGYIPQQDAWDYDRHARSIASGDGYPDSYYAADGGPSALRAPGYPYFLGAIYAVTDDSITAGRLANALLGTLAVLLLYLIVKRIWGQRVGVLATLGMAIFPPLVLLSRDLLSESLFIALELGTVLCLLEFRRSRAWAWAALSGLLCGLAVLTRNPGPALAIPVIVGLWVVRPRRSWRAAAAPALAMICLVLTVMPWTIRNEVEFGRLVPVTTGTGFAMAGTYNELSLHDRDYPGSWRTPRIVPEYASLFTTHGIDEAELDATLRNDATSFALQHPLYVAEVTGWNLLRMFEVTGGSVVGIHGEEVNVRGIGSAAPLSERVGLGIAIPLAILGIYGIVRLRRRGVSVRRMPRGPLFLWLVPILLILVSIPINGLPRQRTPIDPFILILTAIGVAWLLDRLPTGNVRSV